MTKIQTHAVGREGKHLGTIIHSWPTMWVEVDLYGLLKFHGGFYGLIFIVLVDLMM